ncbi:uncharacterized protein LOC110672637 isoform X2 [Hevea brasiliensis]|uniref:uncharacterized protein LOC110672637 isoform X2 n=1 Tax=Hevea brasiliensis TaxID=3981 RepID=UPI0025F2EB53|nr:uncharacterized protein LOC110672637 isoform X2 [Hevea brasiliensis]
MDQDEAKSNENHSSSSRDSNPCPIYVRHFLRESYLDSCFQNVSIIYRYDGSLFQRQYLNENFDLSSFFAKAHKYRLNCYCTESGILSNIVNALQYWKSRKYLQPNRWLQSWWRREIQALWQVFWHTWRKL